MRDRIAIIFLLLGLLFAPVRPAAAQQFGVMGGANFSDVTGEDADEDLDRTTGFLVGAFARLGLGEIITFQPEVQYSQKGAKSGDGAADLELELTYIDVPLFLSFGFPNSFHAMVAPRFSFEVGCDVSVDTGVAEFEGDCDESDDAGVDTRKSFIVGGAVGLGVDVPLGGVNAFIDGRFDIDLESFAEDEDDDIKNRSLQVVAGIRFGGLGR